MFDELTRQRGDQAPFRSSSSSKSVAVARAAMEKVTHEDLEVSSMNTRQIGVSLKALTLETRGVREEGSHLQGHTTLIHRKQRRCTKYLNTSEP